MKRITRLFFFSCLLATIAILPAFAQVDYSTATLKGIVYDPQGAVIGGATVTVINPSTGYTKAVKVKSDGSYTIPVLQPGDYRISVEANGFEKQVVEKYTLQVGTISEYDAHLKVGAATSVIDVTGESAPVIQVTQTQQADYINQVAEQNIPSVSRDYSETIQLLPGVTNAQTVHSSGSQHGDGSYPVNNFTTAGGNGRGGLVTIDGGENDFGSGISRASHVSPDAVQELQVNRNSFNAEFGFTLSEHVNVVTKSGGNDFHGNVFGLFRDQLTDAKPFFQLGNNDPVNQDYHLGGSLGGALIKNKLFFFANIETYRDQVENIKSFNEPQLQGVLANTGADNQAGITGINAQTGQPNPQLAYLNQVTAANPALGAALLNALTPANSPAVQKLIAGQSGVFTGDAKWLDSVVRMDWLPNEANTITARFLTEDENSPLDLGGAGAGYGSTPTNAAVNGATVDTLRDYEVLATWSHIFSPSLLNTLRVQFVPDNTVDLSYNNPFGGATAPFNVFTDGFGTFGPLLGSEYLEHQRRFQFEDSVTWTKGNHTFKFGESYRPVKYTVFDNLYADSQVAYVSGVTPVILALPASLQGALGLFNVLHGLPATGPAGANLTALQAFAAGFPTQIRTSTGNNALISNWANYGGVYFQDSWKVSGRLTVDAGLRFDVDDESFPGSSANYYASPRLGVAYDLFGDHKTLLRAGGGIFVAPAQFQDSYYANLYNPKGSLGFAQTVATLGQPNYNPLIGALAKSGNDPAVSAITAADYAAAGEPIVPGGSNGIGIITPPQGYKNNYGIQASLSIDRELTRNMSLEVGYNMQHTIHLQDPLEVGYVNSGQSNPLLGPLLTPNPANNPLINGQPQFETLTEYCPCGGAIYHAGTISLNRRFADHLQFQTNYTWSKAIDDVLDYSSFTSSYFPTIQGKDRAVSPFNVGQSFTSSAVYTTPFHTGSGNLFLRGLADISLSPVLSIHSGTPFEIFDSPATGAAFNAAGQPTGANGLTQEALNQARPFNAPRDSGINPWNYRWDMRLNKDFKFSRSRENLRLGLSVTAANILNHTNFTGVNGGFPIASAAQANATAFPVLGPNGQVLQTVNVLDGPYNLHGFKQADFVGGVPGASSLAFNSADIARQLQFGLRLSF